MLEYLIETDKQLLCFLNSGGTPEADSLWLVITNELSSIPLYAFLLYLCFKYFHWKRVLLILVFTTIIITTTDQLANVFKVDVKNSFSFFNTDADLSDLVMDTFNDFQLDGRFINVELSTKGAGRDRGGRKRGNDGGRKHGNDEGRSHKKGQRESRKQKTAEALQQAFKKKKKRK